MPKPKLQQLGTVIRHDPQKGACMVADRPLPSGTVVLQEQPHATALPPCSDPITCRTCLAHIPKGTKGVQRCTRCRMVHYCTYCCMSLDRQLHRHSGECWLFSHQRAFSAAAPSTLCREVVLSLRLLHQQHARANSRDRQQQHQQQESDQQGSEGEGIDEQPLQSHAGELTPELEAALEEAQARGHASIGATGSSGGGAALGHLLDLMAHAAAVGRALAVAADARTERKSARQAATAAASKDAGAGGDASRPADSGSTSASLSDDEDDDDNQIYTIRPPQPQPPPAAEHSSGEGVDNDGRGSGVAVSDQQQQLLQLLPPGLEQELRPRALDALCSVVVNCLEVHATPPLAMALLGSAATAAAEAGARGLHQLPLALYLRASRANHSCSPNLAYHFGQGGRVLLRTMTQVAEGDELCIAYTDLATPPAQRQQELRTRYCFSCCCPRCRSTPDSSSSRVAPRLASKSTPAALRQTTTADTRLTHVGPPSGAAAATDADPRVGINPSTTAPGAGVLQQQLQAAVASTAQGLMEVSEPPDLESCYQHLEAALGRALAGGLGPCHYSALEAYALLASAARMCARSPQPPVHNKAAPPAPSASDVPERSAKRRRQNGSDAATAAAAGDAGGTVAASRTADWAWRWWQRAMEAALASVASAELLLACDIGLLQHATSCWCDAASTAAEALAALLDAPAAPGSAQQQQEVERVIQAALQRASCSKPPLQASSGRGGLGGGTSRGAGDSTPQPCAPEEIRQAIAEAAGYICVEQQAGSTISPFKPAIQAWCRWQPRTSGAPTPHQYAPALAVALAHTLARAHALLRLLLGEAHSACEACQFLPFFASGMPYGVASGVVQLSSCLLHGMQ